MCERTCCLNRPALAAVKFYGLQTGLLDKFTHVGKQEESGCCLAGYFLSNAQTIVAYPEVTAGRGSGAVRQNSQETFR